MTSSTLRNWNKRACVKNVEPSETTETDYLEKWFVGNHESMQEFHKDYNRNRLPWEMVCRQSWKHARVS